MVTGSPLEKPLEEFKSYLMAERGLSKNTLDAYTRDIRKFARFLDETGIRSYESVKVGDIVDYMIAEKNSGISINSLSRNIIAIKMFFRFLAGEDFTTKDIAADIDTPRTWKKLPEVLTVKEVDRLLAFPDTTIDAGIRDRAIIEMLYATGMRISELTDLKLNQFDPVERFIICKGKGSKERLVPVGSEAADWTVRYIQNIRPRLVKGKGSAELFISRLGRRYTRQGMWKLLRKYMKKVNAGKKVTPHTLRHTFATHLLSNGAEIRFIQAMMGHASITTTQRYTHVDINRLKSIHRRYHPRG